MVGAITPYTSYICLLQLHHPLLQPSPVQALGSGILGEILQKGNAGAVVIQGFPFPRQDALVEFQNSFPLTEISSATVAPEGWSQSLGNASTWTFRMSLA